MGLQALLVIELLSNSAGRR